MALDVDLSPSILRHLLPVLALLAVGGLLMLISPSLAERFLFLPSRDDPGPPPVVRDVVGRDVVLSAEDGVRVHGWWYEVPMTADRFSPRVLLLHGNAGHIGDRLDLAEGLVVRGISVFLLDYRGYGRSEGRPSEEGVLRDAIAAHAFLAGMEGGTDRVVVFGRSMGGAVGAQLAASVPVAGLILESSFTSLEAMANSLYPILPSILLRRLRGRFSTLESLKKTSIPLLIVHGTEDELVPLRMGLELLEAGGERADWLAVSGAGHNDVFFFGGDLYFSRLATFAFRAVGAEAR
jgi:fermentation-respiration switch protein FrsA (DUF1100 family)